MVACRATLFGAHFTTLGDFSDFPYGYLPLRGVNTRNWPTPSNKPSPAWNKDVTSLYFYFTVDKSLGNARLTQHALHVPHFLGDWSRREDRFVAAYLCRLRYCYTSVLESALTFASSQHTASYLPQAVCLKSPAAMSKSAGSPFGGEVSGPGHGHSLCENPVYHYDIFTAVGTSRLADLKPSDWDKDDPAGPTLQPQWKLEHKAGPQTQVVAQITRPTLSSLPPHLAWDPHFFLSMTFVSLPELPQDWTARSRHAALAMLTA